MQICPWGDTLPWSFKRTFLWCSGEGQKEGHIIHLFVIICKLLLGDFQHGTLQKAAPVLPNIIRWWVSRRVLCLSMLVIGAGAKLPAGAPGRLRTEKTNTLRAEASALLLALCLSVPPLDGFSHSVLKKGRPRSDDQPCPRPEGKMPRARCKSHGSQTSVFQSWKVTVGAVYRVDFSFLV